MAERNYNEERQFTDEKHRGISIPTIYEELGWSVVQRDDELTQIRDSEMSIDYEVVDGAGQHIMLQERFRRLSKYAKMDFTLRYERNENPEEAEQKSEFYKMKAKCRRFSEPFYLLYTILNEDETGYSRYVVVDLKAFFERYRNESIIIDEEADVSFYEAGKLHAPVKFNRDRNRSTGEEFSSSSMVCFDVQFLQEHMPEVIIQNKGFDRRCDECGDDMRIMTNRNTGKKFWGCPNYRNHP